ncbi:MAG: vitamin K epoxide reductase family protein [Candidatus Pacebacteria bacterium]|nr:vitamin K epoxide reductase family protein [Candidatus Paceibacterota bacterium]
MKIGEAFNHKPTENSYATIGIFVVVLSALGLLIAGYLTVRHFQHAQIGVCPVFGDGCDIVTSSKYSVLFGFLPLALLGVFYYLTIFTAQTIYAFSGNKTVLEFSAYISTMGALFSVYLLYLQGFVIGAYCFYCVSSAIVSLLIFLFEIPLLGFYINEKIWSWRVEKSMTILFDKTTE